MKVPSYTFIEFLGLSDDVRAYLESVYTLQKPFEVDCKGWKFGDVKEMQILLSKESVTYETVLTAVEKLHTNVMNMQAHIVIGLFTGVQKSIEQISELESKTLSSRLSAKQVQAMEEVGGFDRFGKFPEIKSVATSWGITYQEAFDMPWDIAFSTLYYDKVQNDYQQKLFEK